MLRKKAPAPERSRKMLENLLMDETKTSLAFDVLYSLDKVPMKIVYFLFKNYILPNAIPAQ